VVATADGAALTEAHRLAQAAIVRQAQTAATVVFHAALDPRDLDGSFSRYVSTMTPVVQAYREAASGTALTYYGALRAAEGVTDPLPDLSPAEAVEDARVATSLLVTGPAAIRSKTAAGMPVGDAVVQALTMTLGSVGRHVTNGQRETLADAVRRDPSAHGYARVSDGRPCAFCAMLVSRGPVYKSQATADFRAHDHCGCGLAPFFEGASGWTAQARAFDALWRESTRGKHGPDAIASFRRAYNGKFPAERLPEPKKVHVPQKKPAVTAPEWRQKFDEAVSRLPADRTRIAKTNGNAAILDDLDREIATEEAIRAERLADGMSVSSQDMRLGILRKNRDHYAAQGDALDWDRTTKGGPGTAANTHLDAVLDAGKALDDELERRIAARMAAPVDEAKIAALESSAAKARETFSQKFHARRDAQTAIDDRVFRDLVEAGRLPRGKAEWDLDDQDARLLKFHRESARRRDPAFQRLQKAEDKARLNMRRIGDELDSLKAPVPGSLAYNTAVREEALGLLKEVREFGGDYPFVSAATRKPLGGGQLRKAMDFAAETYPSDWARLVAARNSRGMKIKSVKRGYNQAGGVEIGLGKHTRLGVLGDEGYHAVAVHELGHSMEVAVPGLQAMEWAYNWRRGASFRDPEGNLVRDRFVHIPGHGPREVASEDEWRLTYSGKVYRDSPDESWEVFTTGAESLFAGSRWFSHGLNGKESELGYDREFRAFILGVLGAL
jgi:hypothetical protein